MAEGTIKKVTDKGFGFIDTGTGKDMFFHMSNLEGVRFDDLYEGQRVSFTEGEDPRAHEPSTCDLSSSHARNETNGKAAEL